MFKGKSDVGTLNNQSFILSNNMVGALKQKQNCLLLLYNKAQRSNANLTPKAICNSQEVMTNEWPCYWWTDHQPCWWWGWTWPGWPAPRPGADSAAWAALLLSSFSAPKITRPGKTINHSGWWDGRGNLTERWTMEDFSTWIATAI